MELPSGETAKNLCVAKFKISLNRCREFGFYGPRSSFLDLEEALQEACIFRLKLAELRQSGNIDDYRRVIHETRDYEKSSILVRFNVPNEVFHQYRLDQPEGRKRFQDEHLFTASPGGSRLLIVRDIIELADRGEGSTTREAMVAARVGQGQFRLDVLAMWDYRCCVTGAETLSAIRASHIKPWRTSSDEERLDPYNGLPLLATLDALFDSGLISFSPDGDLFVSPQLANEEREILAAELGPLRRKPPIRTAKYLEYHREFRYLAD